MFVGIPPRSSCLKINFAGSLLNAGGNGGTGYVVHDYIRRVLRAYSIIFGIIFGGIDCTCDALISRVRRRYCDIHTQDENTLAYVR